MCENESREVPKGRSKQYCSSRPPPASLFRARRVHLDQHLNWWNLDLLSLRDYAVGNCIQHFTISKKPPEAQILRFYEGDSEGTLAKTRGRRRFWRFYEGNAKEILTKKLPEALILRFLKATQWDS